MGVPRGQALHLLTDHVVAILLPGAALSTLGTGSCKIMGPCWRLVVTTSHRESGTHSYNTWQTHTYTQWLSDRQTHKVTHSDDTHTDTLIVRHAGLNFPKLKTRCRELTSCLCCTCSVTCVHFPDNRSNSWLCGTVALTFKATCQCTNHCTYFQHENFTILSLFVKMQNYMNIASKINIVLKLHNMNIEQYHRIQIFLECNSSDFSKCWNI